VDERGVGIGLALSRLKQGFNSPRERHLPDSKPFFHTRQASREVALHSRQLALEIKFLRFLELCRRA